MSITRRRFGIAATVAVVVPATALASGPVRRLFHPLVVRLVGKRSVADRMAEFAPATARVRDQCRAAGLPFPPGPVVLLVLKDEVRLDVFAGTPPERLATHPILAASGRLGPKLTDGDRQVPEGVYGVDSLNASSAFHAALRVAYPNAMDVERGRREGRSDLGGSIMIHGGASSVGCVAMGDDVAEELFVLVAAVGVDRVTIVLSPVDLRHRPLPTGLDGPRFADRYAAVREAMAHLPS